MKNLKTLLWIGLLWFVLVSFWIILSKSDVAMAQFGIWKNINSYLYTWIENVAETIYSIDFSGQTERTVMEGKNGIFYVSTIPVIVKWASYTNVLNSGTSNILWWNGVTINNSNNITIIWWWDWGVSGWNSNATFFWWSENLLNDNENWDLVPTVMLGGKKNEVQGDSDANTIVWWVNNKIIQGAKNVNILWWTSISIGWEDVIAGWQKISGDVSDLFVFSDGNYDGIMDLEWSWMFFLNVVGGVWFGVTPPGTWAISEWSVNIWKIDVSTVECKESTPENIWLIWVVDNQCLVGCSALSAQSWKWTLLDHWRYCDSRCVTHSEYCIQVWQEEDPEWTVEYASFCTVWNVDTGNATMCNSEWVDAYKDVIFQTYLIDSEWICPDNKYNQCAYKCNAGSHLLEDKSGKYHGTTACFKDCSLPWNENIKKKHNEVIIGYTTWSVSCFDTWHTCRNYEKQLICVNGDWYNVNGDVNSDYEVVGVVNTSVQSESCTLYQYTCDPEYNLTRRDIVDQKRDFIDVWRFGNLTWGTAQFLPEFSSYGIKTWDSYFAYDEILQWIEDDPTQLEWAIQTWVRWQYKMCIEYYPLGDPNIETVSTIPQNRQSCGGNFPEQYRYKFIGCNSWYSQTGEDWICRKNCMYGEQEILHWQEITLYTWVDATCPDICHAKTFVCHDWTLYAEMEEEGSAYIVDVPQDSTSYTQTWCSLSWIICDSSYNIADEQYQSMQGMWIFMQCQPYSVSANSCEAWGKVYKLLYCNEDHYNSGDRCEPCPTWYSSLSWSESLNSCKIICPTGTHVAEAGAWCVPCWVWEYKNEHEVDATQYSVCSWCTNLPENAHYTTNGSNGPNSCEWACDEWYAVDWDKCVTLQEALCGIYDSDNFQDLDMYFITNAWAQWHYTLMDRNLWATQVYTWTNNICTYWYYYQWWNNYGFPTTWNVKISTERVDTSQYWPWEYSSDIFIKGVVHPSDWSLEQNDNLWWDVENTLEARRWPCPEWYHVPTSGEFENIVNNYWKKSANNVNYITTLQRSLDSLMPYAGRRRNNDSQTTNQSHQGNYWSSSSYLVGTSKYSFYFIFDWVVASPFRIKHMNRSLGSSVRCFKDTPNSNLTIHPNGWTWALIIVHDGVITKLWTPKKDWYTFWWWYRDPDFESEPVQIWQEAPAELYAKWE